MQGGRAASPSSAPVGTPAKKATSSGCRASALCTHVWGCTDLHLGLQISTPGDMCISAGIHAYPGVSQDAPTPMSLSHTECHTTSPLTSCLAVAVPVAMAMSRLWRDEVHSPKWWRGAESGRGSTALPHTPMCIPWAVPTCVPPVGAGLGGKGPWLVAVPWSCDTGCPLGAPCWAFLVGFPPPHSPWPHCSAQSTPRPCQIPCQTPHRGLLSCNQMALLHLLSLGDYF